MDEDTNYNWDTNSWIRNSRDKPMWQLWSDSNQLGEINEEATALTDTSISSLEYSTILMMPLSMHSVTNSPLILPPPPVRICKNSFGQQQHLLISLLTHLLIWICRVVVNKVR